MSDNILIATDSLMEELCKEFQARLGPLPVVRIVNNPYPHQPDLKCPVLLTRPSSLTEVIRVVRTASTMKLRVRGVGRCNNYQTNLYSDELNVLVEMNYLKDEPKIQIVDHKMSNLEYVPAVRVLAGVTVGDLCDFQIRNQLRIVANISDSDHTVVGAVVSGLHATSNKHYGTLADQVLQIRAVDRRGHLVEYENYSDGIVNLGMVGIVYDVTIQVEESTCVEVQYKFEKMGGFQLSPNLLKGFLDSYESVRLIYYPMNAFSKGKMSHEEITSAVHNWDSHEDEVIVRLTSPSSKDPGEREFLYLSGEYETKLTHLENTKLSPLFSRDRHLQQKIDKKKTTVQYYPWAVHCYVSTNNNGDNRQSDLTITLSIGKDMHKFGQVLGKFQEIVHNYGREGRFPLNLCVRVDFTPGSRCRMAPGFDERLLRNVEEQESVKEEMNNNEEIFWYAHIRCSSIRNEDEHWAQACSLIMEEIWRIDSSCIMQWNSDWGFVKGHIAALTRYHGKSKDQLKKIVELVDRDGMFLNESLKTIFYPSLDGYRALYDAQRQLFLEKLSS